MARTSAAPDAASENPDQKNPETPTQDDRNAQAARDDQLLRSYADALADEVERALPGWVGAAVAARTGGRIPHQLADAVAGAGTEAAADVGGQVRSLLELDIDDQWTNPLTLVRTAIKYPNQVLRDAGVAPISRDAQSERFHPEDVYGLIPSSFADLGPTAHDLGLSWGAAKAHVHLRRRRAEEVS
ncbi:MAG: hypothetical protein AAGA65_13095 [Actinomycetota bacterium]